MFDSASSRLTTRKVRFAGVISAAAFVVLLPATAASATVTHSGPPKFKVVESAPISAPNDAQSSGSAACPSGLVVLGGGVQVETASTGASIADSTPSGDALWAADIVNTSGGIVTWTVFADCAKEPRKYSIVESTAIANPPGQQNDASVDCPAGTVILGGGNETFSGADTVTVNTSVFFGDETTSGWLASENNNSGEDNTVTAVAICGAKPAGYLQVNAAAVSNPARTQTAGLAECPSPTVAISGGASTDTGDTQVALHSTQPEGDNWLSAENNASGSPDELFPSAICAGS